jgi:eukaryotic-like serine/threonine-protein kinase
LNRASVALSKTRPELSTLLEARVAELLSGVRGEALAKTLAAHRGETIEPRPSLGKSGQAAVATLRALGAQVGDKFEMHQTLGEGGMGVVHLATQATVGRHVAVKTLKPGLTDEDATIRILREAWITGTLEHPNIVPIYDVGVDAAGAPVIVMKRIEGRSWADVLAGESARESGLSTEGPHLPSLEVLASVCNAVHFAHSRGVLHRDLKPENVMIGAFGEVYVLDWGIAVSLKPDPTGRLPMASAATDIAGTPEYMAPEMLLGDPTKLSERTDVYLLGAMLYEVVTGAPPHRGENLQVLVSSILTSPPDVPSGVPDELRGICTRAMSLEPADRYESAEAFREAIVEYVRHRGSLRLAREADRSLLRLLTALEAAPSEDRTRDVQIHLGECRFGYRAALTAWSGNDEARAGLDRALIAAVEDAVVQGDTKEAEALLREVAHKPEDVVKRVAEAVVVRVKHDERLHKLETDYDPTIGSRTRILIGLVFGVIWTAFPLVSWWSSQGHDGAGYPWLIRGPIIFLIIGSAFFVWARESMMKTALNRGIMATGGVYQVAQLVMSVAGHAAGLSVAQTLLASMFGWSLVFGLLAVWVEPWFGIVAASALAALVASSVHPELMFPLMSAHNFIFTIVFVRVWFPRDKLEAIRARRASHLARIRASLHRRK